MKSDQSIILRVRGLQTWYGHVKALRDVDLSVERGQIACVLGANGAGKSTLLNTIAGVVDPRAGTIVFEGREIQCLAPDAVSRSGVVLVPEGRQLFSFLSVEENLRMGAFARGSDQSVQDDLDRVYDWFPRLLERRRQQAGLMSGGEQQMVAIGRGYMSRPKLLLLDEPSLGLSPRFTKEIFAIVKRIRDETRTAILVVEQNAAIAIAASDHVFVLELGRVVASGSAAEMRARDDIQTFYLGASAPAHATAAEPHQAQQAHWY